MDDDLLDDPRLVNTANDAQRAPTPHTTQGIGRIDFLNQRGGNRYLSRIGRPKKLSASAGTILALSQAPLSQYSRLTLYDDPI